MVSALGTVGAANNTLVLFTSDNGPALRWGVGAGNPGIFTGRAAAYANGTTYTNTAKGSTWEGGVRMPAFAYWPGVIQPGSVAYTTISSLDVLPSLVRLAGRPPPSGRILDGTVSLAEAILQDGSPPTRHAFLPLYNNPVYGNASRHIFAARVGRYKLHWITSPGLTPESATAPSPMLEHNPPIVFDVVADPSEAYPLEQTALPLTLLADATKAKRVYEEGLIPTSIDPNWGYEFALCCGVGCPPPPERCICQCHNVQLPLGE